MNVGTGLTGIEGFTELRHHARSTDGRVGTAMETDLAGLGAAVSLQPLVGLVIDVFCGAEWI